MDMDSLDFSPLQLLEEDLSSSDRSARLRGVRGLKSLALTIGCERTRREMMPIIHRHIDREQDDEVLHEIAGTFGDFVTELGGPEHVNMLYAPLCDLARVEETVVHDRATTSLIDAMGVSCMECVDRSKSSGLGSSVFELSLHVLKQLSGVNTATPGPDVPASESSGLGARMSAVRLVAPVIRVLIHAEREDSLAVVYTIFRKLACDDTPSVRRTVSAVLGSVAAAIPSPEVFARELSHVIWSLLADENDLVRLVAMRTLGSEVLKFHPGAAEAWNNATQELRCFKRAHTSITPVDTAKDTDALLAGYCASTQYLLSGDDVSHLDPALAIAAVASEDGSWRVREALARSFEGYLAHYCRNERSTDTTVGSLLGIFSQLFVDHEVEVRIAAFESSNRVAAVARRSFADHPECVTCACRGVNAAEHPRVRVAAAKALTQLIATLSPIQHQRTEFAAGQLPNERAQITIFGVVTNLFSDENVEVLLATLGELKDAVPYMASDAAARVVQLVESTEHENWRVRRAINRALPPVAATCDREAFESQLLSGFVRTFQDRIFQVRSSAVDALAALRQIQSINNGHKLVFDADWLMEKVGNRLSERYLTMSYYVYRITIIQAFETIAGSRNLADQHMESIVTFLSDATRDEVPNVRLAAVQALETASASASDRILSGLIRPVLNEMTNDKDPDVKLAIDRGGVLL